MCAVAPVEDKTMIYIYIIFVKDEDLEGFKSSQQVVYNRSTTRIDSDKKNRLPAFQKLVTTEGTRPRPLVNTPSTKTLSFFY
jgi:hypothetical protein